jgi:hypothetical protein
MRAEEEIGLVLIDIRLLPTSVITTHQDMNFYNFFHQAKKDPFSFKSTPFLAIFRL